MEKPAPKASFQNLFAHPCISKFNKYSQAVLGNINTCHTPKKGYHLYKCNNVSCNESKYQYHCCGNRHCPFCGSMKREEWVENRMNELLPTSYYHMVFTLPHELNSLILGNRKLLFNTLFESVTETILNHGKNEEFLGAEPGITMVLHTWGQDMSFHPHIHCIVSGGGFDGSNWKPAKRKNNRFLFPEKSLKKMYKAIMMKALEQNEQIKWEGICKAGVLKSISYKTWNVYAKAPFGGPAQVIEYLGRYTHKIAITKHRIEELTEKQIKFRYKDYADCNKVKSMWLCYEEFLRRFELHILPKRFVKIRHSGFLKNRDKHKRINAIRASIGLGEAPSKVTVPIAIRMLEKYGTDISICTCCKTGTLILLLDTKAKRIEKQKPFPKVESS